jgi:hypothetical protein
MADTAVSAVETALENQRIGSLQIRVVVLCTAGADLRRLRRQLDRLGGAVADQGVGPAAAGIHASVSVVEHRHHGRRAVAGPIGDRIRPQAACCSISLTIFGVASLLSATAGSLDALKLWRFFTGLGIGGGFAGAASLTGDYTPAPPARDDDHGQLHRRADRRLCRRPDRALCCCRNSAGR